MGWLNPSNYEKELLANLRNNLAQDIIDLAKFAVLTPRIEPLLLRNIRLEMMPGSETELEHWLWFSAFVNARSTRAIVLHQGIARLLIGCRNCVKLALKYGGVNPLFYANKKRPVTALSFVSKLSAL